MTAPSDTWSQRAVRKLRLLVNDSAVRIITLSFLSGLFGLSAVLHFIFFTDGGAPRKIHIVLLACSFFIAMYLSLSPNR
jgi:hypothetical protein